MTEIDKGAHYRRADLQVHTPRDSAWKGKRPLGDEDRGRYGEAFVGACRARALDAVAITDHHDLVFVDYIRNAAAQETGVAGEALDDHERLVVFPGLELSLTVPCQALLILDADFPSEKFSSVLDLLTIEVVDPEAEQHGEVVQVEIESLNTLHEHLSKSKWLAGRFAILPNVTARGHQTLIRKGMQARYKEMPCVGGYIDGSIDKQGTGPKAILDGTDKQWGNKRIAVIQTSDSRSSTFDALGEHSTWIKWAEPTAEALRQACLAQESRISLIEPDLPGVHVTELRVSNSQFLGPVELALNLQYNALIGGRGTGKSTCLEYLRWALCDQPPELEDDDDMPNHAARRARLIEQTLMPHGANVEVDFILNGIPHMVRRYAEGGEVQLKVGDRELEDATPEEIRALLPIEAYSQRQLSSVGVRIDELTRFVTAPVRETLALSAARVDDIAAQIRKNYAQLQRQRALERAMSQETLALASLDQQAENMRDKLTGLSEADRECLSQKPSFDRADSQVRAWVRRVESARDEAEALRVRLNGLRAEADSADPDLPEAETLAAIAAAADEALDAAQDAADKAAHGLAEALSARGGSLAASRKTWEKALKAFQKRYAAATERSSAHASKLSELEALEERQQAVRESIAENRTELASLGDPSGAHAELRGEWQQVQAERSAVMEQQCERLTSLSEGLIRATVRKGAGTEPLLEPFKAAVAGSAVRAAKIEKFLDKVAASEDPLDAWLAAMDELEDRVLRTAEAGGLPALQTALSAFAESDIEKVVKRLTPENVLELLLLSLSDQPVFEYGRKENDYIQFSDASAGQQATALLRVLLSQPGPPLIIDQPEDDLDSQVIQQIVDQIWDAKHRRQLIFSSHNANLVVNGDAELVICFDYRKAGDHSGGKIKLQGAIDIPKVSKEITQVMEGGEKAFRLRKEKYGF